MGAIVTTVRLIECMRVTSGPDPGGLIGCYRYVEPGDALEYDAMISRDVYGDFSVGRWLWVFQDLRRVEPISINGRQGVWNLPSTDAAELASG